MVRLITFLSLSLSQVQECIRRLVSVIRRSSTGGSPVDSEQLEHIQKVVRVLSLSEEQVSSMRFEERAQVLSPGYEACLASVPNPSPNPNASPNPGPNPDPTRCSRSGATRCRK